jgi:hypothetical protein
MQPSLQLRLGSSPPVAHRNQIWLIGDRKLREDLYRLLFDFHTRPDLGTPLATGILFFLDTAGSAAGASAGTVAVSVVVVVEDSFVFFTFPIF